MSSVHPHPLVMSSVVETSLRLCRLRPKGAFMRSLHALSLGRDDKGGEEESLGRNDKQGGEESLGRDDKGRENRFKVGKKEEKEQKNSVSLYLCVLNKKQKNENSNSWWRGGGILSGDKPERDVP